MNVLDIIFGIILEPIYCLLRLPNDYSDKGVPKKLLSKTVRWVFVWLIGLVLIFALAAIIGGTVVLNTGKTEDDKSAGLFLLIVGLAVLFIYAVIVAIRLLIKRKRKRKAAERAETGDVLKQTVASQREACACKKNEIHKQ